LHPAEQAIFSYYSSAAIFAATNETFDCVRRRSLRCCGFRISTQTINSRDRAKFIAAFRSESQEDPANKWIALDIILVGPSAAINLAMILAAAVLIFLIPERRGQDLHASEPAIEG
jgi:hypothetical protein